MFNQSGFNLTPFNREFTVDVFGNFELQGYGELSVGVMKISYGGFDLEGVGELDFTGVADKFAAFVLEAIGELEFESGKELYGSFDLQGVGEIEFIAGRNRVNEIEFTGTFAPGDRIIIDSKQLSITQNGQNALHSMQGDFFGLNLGQNEITYTDDQTGRTVLIRITHRDKFV